jgi:hypothetical protein
MRVEVGSEKRGMGCGLETAVDLHYFLGVSQTCLNKLLETICLENVPLMVLE